MRIKKDYSKRPRTPAVNIQPPNMASDDAKMGAPTAGSQSNTESMIAHETAMHARNKRSQIANKKLGKQ